MFHSHMYEGLDSFVVRRGGGGENTSAPTLLQGFPQKTLLLQYIFLSHYPMVVALAKNFGVTLSSVIYYHHRSSASASEEGNSSTLSPHITDDDIGDIDGRFHDDQSSPRKSLPSLGYNDLPLHLPAGMDRAGMFFILPDFIGAYHLGTTGDLRTAIRLASRGNNNNNNKLTNIADAIKEQKSDCEEPSPEMMDPPPLSSCLDDEEQDEPTTSGGDDHHHSPLNSSQNNNDVSTRPSTPQQVAYQNVIEIAFAHRGEAVGHNKYHFLSIDEDVLPDGRLVRPTQKEVWCPSKFSSSREFVEGCIRNGQVDVIALLLRYCTLDIEVCSRLAVASGWTSLIKLFSEQPYGGVDLQRIFRDSLRHSNAEAAIWLLGERGVSDENLFFNDNEDKNGDGKKFIPTLAPYGDLLREVGLTSSAYYHTASPHQVELFRKGMLRLKQSSSSPCRPEGYFINRDGFYGGESRQEILFITQEENNKWMGLKVKGDRNVPRGKYSFQTKLPGELRQQLLQHQHQGMPLPDNPLDSEGAIGHTQIRIDVDDPSGFSWRNISCLVQFCPGGIAEEDDGDLEEEEGEEHGSSGNDDDHRPQEALPPLPQEERTDAVCGENESNAEEGSVKGERSDSRAKDCWRLLMYGRQGIFHRIEEEEALFLAFTTTDDV